MTVLNRLIGLLLLTAILLLPGCDFAVFLGYSNTPPNPERRP